MVFFGWICPHVVSVTSENISVSSHMGSAPVVACLVPVMDLVLGTGVMLGAWMPPCLMSPPSVGDTPVLIGATVL